MNDEWSEEDARGARGLRSKDNHIATIPPKGGRLLVFLSEQFPEVFQPTPS